MRTRVLVLTVAITPLVVLGPSAVATAPGSWGHLGHGASAGAPALNGHVTALNTQRPGVLYVGGAFTNAGGHPNADRLAEWNGRAWSAVNGSQRLNGAVDAIAYHAGHLYVGGEFTNVRGNDNIDYLAEWTGTAWKSPCTNTGLGAPITAQVAALKIIGKTLYVGGAFQDGASIAAADFLLACDLTTGAPSATVAADGDFDGGVLALTADSNGTLYAGGSFLNVGGVVGLNHVAYYQGGAWHQMGGNNAVDDRVRSLTARGTNVYIGTDATDINGIATADHVARWNASTLAFSALGSDHTGTSGWFDSFAFINALTTQGSLVFAAGSFQNADGHATADDIAYFDGNAWHALGSNGAGNGPMNSPVNALAVSGSDLVAGGNFTAAGGDSHAVSVASRSLRLPDVAIGKAKGGPFVGNSVYSSTGAREVRRVTVKRGRHDTSYVRIQNDGLDGSSFTIKGLGQANGIRATWFVGSKNVTTRVAKGTYFTDVLAPGDDVVLRVVVHVAKSSAKTATIITRATSSSLADDAVRLHVKAKG